MILTVYKCRDCRKVFEDKNEYKEHVKDTVTGLVESLNNLLQDAKEVGLFVGIMENFEQGRRWFEVMEIRKE